VTNRTLALTLVACAFLLPACGDDVASTPEPGGQSAAPTPAEADTDGSGEDPTSDY
jgi:hypothetical protein